MAKHTPTQKLLAGTILLAAFILINYLRHVLNLFNSYTELPDLLRYSVFYGIQILLCFLFAFSFLRLGKFQDRLIESLGFNKPFLKSFAWAFVISLPMLAGYWIVSGINGEVTFEDIAFWSVISPFTEELFYRALLIGFMFRYLRLGFLPAALIVSVVFGLGHLYQAENLMESFGVFGLTLFGSLLFGWVYLEWKYNLWLIFGLHMLMNLYWNVFDIEASNAIGGWAANIFRFLTIIAAVGFTLRMNKRQDSAIKGRWLK